jgi:hypothetical protein
VAQHPARPRADGVQQLRRLVQAALADAEVGQPDVRLGRLAPVRVPEAGDGRVELALGLPPLAPRHQRAAVVGAADGDHQLERPALAELLQPLAPLGRAPEVAHPLAGRDEAAGDGPGLVHPAELAGERGRARLVQLAHASATSPSLTRARPS